MHFYTIFEYFYRVYRRKLKGKRAVTLKDLPPTTSVAEQHLLRIYLQVPKLIKFYDILHYCVTVVPVLLSNPLKFSLIYDISFSSISISLIQVQEWIGNPGIDPLDFGWETCTESGEFMPTQGISDICPKSIQDILSCKCKKGCNSNKCSCKKHGLMCSPMCDCDECENVKSDQEEIDCDDDEIEYEEVDEDDVDL